MRNIKYNGEIAVKQRKLFDQLKAKRKVIIKGISDLEGFLK